MVEVPGRRRRETTKRRWLDNIRNTLPERELSGEEAQDRTKLERMQKEKKEIFLYWSSEKCPTFTHQSRNINLIRLITIMTTT